MARIPAEVFKVSACVSLPSIIASYVVFTLFRSSFCSYDKFISVLHLFVHFHIHLPACLTFLSFHTLSFTFSSTLSCLPFLSSLRTYLSLLSVPLPATVWSILAAIGGGYGGHVCVWRVCEGRAGDPSRWKITDTLRGTGVRAVTAARFRW